MLWRCRSTAFKAKVALETAKPIKTQVVSLDEIRRAGLSWRRIIANTPPSRGPFFGDHLRMRGPARSEKSFRRPLVDRQTGLYNSGMSKTRAKSSDARQRIVETAERLFYAEGIRAVGIDRIIAEAGVAKMSLYNHFPSKDDLILAVLQYREEKFDGMFKGFMDQHAGKGMGRLEAFFAALKDWFESPGFRGCMFINAHVELADVNHPASQFSARHKERFHQMLRTIIEESVGVKSEAVAPAIALLVEGAIVIAVMAQSSESAEAARDAALALMAQAKRT